MTTWHDIAPADAKTLDLREHPELGPPLNENGDPCPWPWNPQQLTGGAPLGTYHCPHCAATCVAGIPHIDYRDDYEGFLERRARGDGEFGDDTIPIAKLKPRRPDITVNLTGTPANTAAVLKNVADALADAGAGTGTIGEFARDAARSGTFGGVLYAAATWVNIQ